MIKKCSNYLLTAICVFFVSLMGASAKEVTVDGLTELVKEFNPQANSVFVIGEYAFTSGHELTLQDIMLASRSIKVPEGSGDINTDPIYKEMIIDAFNGTLNSNFELESLTYAGNLIGDASNKQTYNIRYVDYNKVAEEIDLVKLAKEIYGIYENNYASSMKDILEANLDQTGTSLSVNVKNLNPDLSFLSKEQIKEDLKQIIQKLKDVKGIKSINITITTSDGNKLEKELTGSEVEALTKLSKDELVAKAKDYAQANSLTLDLLVNGTLTLKVNLKDGYKAANGIDTFNASLKAEIDLKGLADKAYSKYNKDYAAKVSKFFVVDTKDGITYDATVKAVLPDLSLIPEDKLNEIKTQLKEKAKKFVELAKKVPGVKSVTITATTSDGNKIEEEVTVSDVEALTKLNKDELLALVKDYADKNSLTIDSLVGGSLTAKVNLKDGYTAKDGIDTFNVTLKAEIDFKGTLDKVYSKYQNDYAAKLEKFVVVDTKDGITYNATLKAVLADLSLIPEDKLNEVKAQAKDKLKDVKAILDKVTYVPGIQSVTVTLKTSEGQTITVNITAEEALALKDKSLDELKAIAKAFITANNLTIDSAVGGEASLKINLKDGYSAKDGIDTFNATLKAELDIKGAVDKAYEVYEDKLAGKLNNFVDLKLKDTTFDVTAKLLTTDTSLLEEKINELKVQYKDEIAKVRDLLDKVTYIPALKSVDVTLKTSDGQTVTANITAEEALALKDKSLDELKAIVKAFITAKGLTIDSVIGGEATLKINLKNGYSAKDGIDTFNATFKAVYDLKTLAETAYDKFNSEYAELVNRFNIFSLEKVEKNIEEKYIGTEYNITVKTTDEGTITALANVIKPKLADLLNKVKSVPGINTVTVKVMTSDSRTFTKDFTLAHLDLFNQMSVEELKAALKALMAKHNLSVSSILDGKVEAKFNFKKGYSAKDNIDTFKINIIAAEAKVYFDVDGAITSKTVKIGSVLEKPENPTKEGHVFDKWLLNGVEYDFNARINGSIELTASWIENAYEVTIAIPDSDNGYGTLNKTKVTVKHGTTVTTDGNVLKIGEEEIIATPTANTEQYKYSFDKWVGAPTKIEGSLVITARFARADSLYKVSVAADELGNVSETSVKDVPYGTAITTNGNVLKIGDKEITATPLAKDAEYTYSFDKWNISESTVTKDLTITASFKKEVNKYLVSFAYNDENFGKVNKTSIEVPYGSEIKIDGNKITIGEEEIIATPATETAQYKYSFKNWTNVPTSNKVTESTVIYANFNQTEISLYTLTFKTNDSTMGSVDKTTITNLQSGTEIKVNGNKITIGEETITATVTGSDENYNFSFDKWDMSSNTVSTDMTITAIFKKEAKKYDVSISANNANYGSVSAPSINASYDSVITTDGNKITIDGTTVTATPKAETNTKYYTFESWTVSTDKVTSTTTVTANFKEWTKVNVASNVSSAVNASYGDNKLGESHSMAFTETNNTITLKYSGSKSSKWFVLSTLNGTAVESFDIIQLMEKLVDGYDNIYESVIWDYMGWKTKNDDTGDYEYLDILKLDYDNMNVLGFNAQNWSCTIFARFMSKLSGLSGGSNFANIDLDTMIANTTANPIKMKIKLKDGYVSTDGKTEVVYNIVFAK